MISTSEFKKGLTFELKGDLYQVIDFQHVKPARGAAFVRTKIRNIKTGAIREETFNPNDRFVRAPIDTKEMQYLYSDGDLYYFMDNETYDQIPLNYDIVENTIKYLKENDNVMIKFYKNEAFEVQPPISVELKVVHTEPGVKGDTAAGATKKAELETGAVVQVPLFIEIGEIIKVDTRTNDYISRV